MITSSTCIFSEPKIMALNSSCRKIEISASQAYFEHRLTTEDLFSKEDCDKVLAGMDFYNIISFQDAKSVLENEKAAIITRNDILAIAESF